MISQNLNYSKQRIAKKKAVEWITHSADAMFRATWRNNALCLGPTGTAEDFVRLHREAIARSTDKIDRIEEEFGHKIDRDFLDDLALHTQVVIKKSPLSWNHGRVLYSVLMKYLHDFPPEDPTDKISIVETGTARGFSSLCMAKALQDYGRAGTILTVDVLPHDSPMYWNCIDDLEGPKSRRDLLAPWHQLADKYIVYLWGTSTVSLTTMATNRIHFAFLDAVHDYESVMFEVSKIKPKQKPGDIIVFDDVSEEEFPGVAKAVAEICQTDYAGYTVEAGVPRDEVSDFDRKYCIATKL